MILIIVLLIKHYNYTYQINPNCKTREN